MGFRHVEYDKEILLRFAQPILHFLLRRSIVLASVKGRRVYEHNIILSRVPQSSLCILSELASDCLYLRRVGSKVCANFDEIAFCHIFHELRGRSSSTVVHRGRSYQTLSASRRAHHTGWQIASQYGANLIPLENTQYYYIIVTELERLNMLAHDPIQDSHVVGILRGSVTSVVYACQGVEIRGGRYGSETVWPTLLKYSKQYNLVEYMEYK